MHGDDFAGVINVFRMSYFARFFRQSVYALTFFTGAALALEFVAPGSVSPFIDPVPLAGLALAALCVTALSRRP